MHCVCQTRANLREIYGPLCSRRHGKRNETEETKRNETENNGNETKRNGKQRKRKETENNGNEKKRNRKEPAIKTTEIFRKRNETKRLRQKPV